LKGQVGDRCNCEFWPSRVLYLPTPTANSRHEARPYLPTPPPALNSDSARPPGGRSDTCLPLRGARLPHDHTYLPSRRFFQLQRSPTCLSRFAFREHPSNARVGCQQSAASASACARASPWGHESELMITTPGLLRLFPLSLTCHGSTNASGQTNLRGGAVWMAMHRPKHNLSL
jgi:hypothetical protein